MAGNLKGTVKGTVWTSNGFYAFSLHILQGGEVLEEHCTIELQDGIATLESKPDAQCWVNSQLVDKPSRLTQG